VPSPCLNSNFATQFLTIGLTKIQSVGYYFVENFLLFQKYGGIFNDFAGTRLQPLQVTSASCRAYPTLALKQLSYTCPGKTPESIIFSYLHFTYLYAILPL